MPYEVFTDWSWVKPKRARKQKESIYPFRKMQPGQYFLIPKESVDSQKILYNRINQAAMRFGVLFKIKQQLGDDNIWYYRIYHNGYRG